VRVDTADAIRIASDKYWRPEVKLAKRMLMVAVLCISAVMPSFAGGADGKIAFGAVVDNGLNPGLSMKMPGTSTFLEVSGQLINGGVIGLSLYSYLVDFRILPIWSVNAGPVLDAAYSPVTLGPLSYVSVLPGVRLGTSVWLFDRIELGFSASLVGGLHIEGQPGGIAASTIAAIPLSLFARYNF
jgi:hypothetical protein